MALRHGRCTGTVAAGMLLQILDPADREVVDLKLAEKNKVRK